MPWPQIIVAALMLFWFTANLWAYMVGVRKRNFDLGDVTNPIFLSLILYWGGFWK